MEQPRVYNTEDELIKWLKTYLKKQKEEVVKKDKLILDIGNNDNPIIIDFKFKLINIIKELDKTKYKTNNTIIDCKINFCKITFNQEVDFSNLIFYNVELNFSSSEFKDKVYFIGTKFIPENPEKPKNNIIFDDTTFSKEVNFYKASFCDISFFSTKFNLTKVLISHMFHLIAKQIFLWFHLII